MGGGGNLNLSCKKIRNGTPPPPPPSFRGGPASHKKRGPLERRENGKFLDLILSFRGKFVPQWAGMFRTFLCYPKSETLSTRLLRLCWWWLRRRGQGDLQVVRRLTTVSLSSSQQDANFKFPFSFPEGKGTKALTAEADTLTIPHMQRQQPASMEVGQTNPQRERKREILSAGDQENDRHSRGFSG